MKKMVLALFLLLAIPFTGCWDIRDVSNRAYITAIGIDKGQETIGNYRITFEIINPAKLRSGSNPATTIETVDGASIGQAIEKLQTRIPQTVSLDHFRVLLLGEEQGKEDFRDIISYFEKNPQVALRFKLGFVQHGRAEDILNCKPRCEKSISDEYVAMTQLEKDFSLARDRSFNQFVADLRGSEGDGFITRVTGIEENKMMLYHGGAVLKNWRLTGWLSEEETQAANWLLGKGSTTVICKKGDSTYTYGAEKKTVHIIPQVAEDKISFTVKAKISGNVIEQKGHPMDLSNPKNVAELERAISQVIGEQVKQALDKSQNIFAVDYLGLGKALHKEDPNFFKTLDWRKIFPFVSIKVSVETTINTFGLTE